MRSANVKNFQRFSLSKQNKGLAGVIKEKALGTPDDGELKNVRRY